jgi:catechol 2,3-dioxygenase-like lactoylglutathione lyase family enzyme
MKMAPLIPELYCSDFATSLAFYTHVLGFYVLYQREENDFAMLEREGTQIMLEQLNEASWIDGDAPMEPPFGRGMSFQIETKDVDALYQSVQDAQSRIYRPMEEKWYRADDVYLGNRQFIVCDPDGFLLRFFQDLGSRDHGA